MDKHICQLQLPCNIISNPKLILNEQKKYYQNLYSDISQFEEKITPLFNNCFSENLSTLTEDETLLCEGFITELKCAEVLTRMSNGKSPGCDGFTVDILKVFWKDIKMLLFESINYSYMQGELSVDQKREIITLIPKKDRKRLLLKTYKTYIPFEHRLQNIN